MAMNPAYCILFENKILYLKIALNSPPIDRLPLDRALCYLSFFPPVFRFPFPFTIYNLLTFHFAQGITAIPSISHVICSNQSNFARFRADASIVKMVSLSKQLILFCLCTLFFLNLSLTEAKSAQIDGNEWRGTFFFLGATKSNLIFYLVDFVLEG